MLEDINRGLVAKLAIFHIIVITLSNYTIQFTSIFIDYQFTWAMFIFPLVILSTDLTVRLSNKYNASVIVGLAYIPAILISTWLADWRIGLASGTAYLIGQLMDITVFQKIREKVKHWWVAPMISTLFANIVDNYVFFPVAFYRSSNEFMVAHWPQIATVDLMFKIIVSIVLFLPIYGILLGYLKARLAAD